MENEHLNSQQTFSQLIERLEYKSSPCFISDETTGEQIPIELDITWREAKDKLGVDAVYFVADAPVIYFKRFEAFDRRKIAELHRNVWSQSKTPLLFVVLLGEIRIYSGYEEPKPSDDGFDEPTRLENELDPYSQNLSDQRPRSQDEFWKRFSIFTRIAIDSESFWRDYGNSLHKETRVDQVFITNLRHIRRELVSAGLNLKFFFSLIGRSIFTLYLQDRGVLQVGEQGFFAQNFQGAYTNFIDLLVSREDTYKFFTMLNDRFMGDLFPVTTEEQRNVTSMHLALLRELFTVDRRFRDKQPRTYNFEFIPIELISAMYEESLERNSGEINTYHTLPILVDFLVDEALPWDDLNYAIHTLDPSCGSGIFLVSVYRRLIERWRRANKQNPSPAVLIDILKSFIFGVDISQQALHTSASWGVEREEIKASEMKMFPIPFFDIDSEKMSHITALADELIQNAHVSSPQQIEHELNDLIYDCFRLNVQERQHIRETIAYTIEFFRKPENSPALKGNVTLEMKRSYASAFMRSINFYMEAVDRKLASTVYVEETSPLLTVKFELYMHDDEIADIQEEVPDPEMLRTLSDLDKMSIENVSGRLYHRRNFRIYQNEGDTLFLIKPAEPRYWTIGAALADAQVCRVSFSWMARQAHSRKHS